MASKKMNLSANKLFKTILFVIHRNILHISLRLAVDFRIIDCIVT